MTDYSARPLTVGDLQAVLRFIKWALVPMVMALFRAVIWVRDTNAAVDRLNRQVPRVDSALHVPDNKLDVVDAKVDLLLQDRFRTFLTEPKAQTK